MNGTLTTASWSISVWSVLAGPNILWVFPKIMVPPNHHPFWGTPILGNIHIDTKLHSTTSSWSALLVHQRWQAASHLAAFREAFPGSLDYGINRPCHEHIEGKETVLATFLMQPCRSLCGDSRKRRGRWLSSTAEIAEKCAVRLGSQTYCNNPHIGWGYFFRVAWGFASTRCISGFLFTKPPAIEVQTLPLEGGQTKHQPPFLPRRFSTSWGCTSGSSLVVFKTWFCCPRDWRGKTGRQRLHESWFLMVLPHFFPDFPGLCPSGYQKWHEPNPVHPFIIIYFPTRNFTPNKLHLFILLRVQYWDMAIPMFFLHIPYRHPP